MPIEHPIANAVDITDWIEIVDLTAPPVFQTSLRTPTTREVVEVVTTTVSDFPFVNWSTCSEDERRVVFRAMGRVHLGRVLVARLRPELRAEAERRLGGNVQSDPRGLGAVIEGVVRDVRRELGSSPGI